MPKDLLLEIGVEEIPASYLEPAAQQLRDILKDLLSKGRIGFGDGRVYFTPRRLALYLRDVEEHQASLVSEVVGPLASVAFDPEGNPTEAALGFARARGVGVEELKVKETERGEVVYCEKSEEGVTTDILLKEVLPQAIKGVEFPKSMWWESTKLRFARPIRWVLALYGKEQIEFQIAGLVAGRDSRSHRFLKGSLRVKEPASYEKVLEKGRVLVDPDRRMKAIIAQIEEEARKVGGEVAEDTELLSEVTSLVEYPVAILGKFDERYLALPHQVLVTALREHQRYFAVENKEGGLLSCFVFVTDSPSGDREAIRSGNERILGSRLADAKFYWDEDRKEEFPKFVERLKGVVWQEGAGSLYDKTQRVVDVTRYLFDQIGEGELEVMKRGAYLSKADLVSAMVRDGKEFTTLQGVMGREYALASGEEPRVAQVIYEHHLPRFPGDELPESSEGAMVSIGDKVDTICSSFAVGKTPTGSQDPLGLRRQANGILAILIGRSWHISLPPLVHYNLNQLGATVDLPSRKELEGTILDFLRQRVERYLEDKGISYDIAGAVVEVGWGDVADAMGRALALSSLRETPDFEKLVLGQKRVANILIDQPALPSVDESLLKEEGEKAIYHKAKELEKDFFEMIERRDYSEAVQLLLSLREPIDRLFDEVLIMAEEEDLRLNRLGLVGYISKLFLRVADLSKIVLEGG